MKIKLKTSLETFDKLHLILDASRPSTETIKVPRQALSDLLKDHSTMFRELGSKVE